MEKQFKVYLAHPISTIGEARDSKRVAERLRELGFIVYAAAENASINDKSNNPEPVEIYDADVPQLISSDIMVVNLTGGNQDGTVFELGGVSLWNHAMSLVDQFLNDDLNLHVELPFKRPEIILYTSNLRALQPQFHKGIASASLNHLNLAGADKWGDIVRTEDAMVEYLKEKYINNRN